MFCCSGKPKDTESTPAPNPPPTQDWFKHTDYLADYSVEGDTETGDGNIGTGSFGNVFKAVSKSPPRSLGSACCELCIGAPSQTCKATSQRRAIKVIPASKIRRHADSKALQRECNLLLKYGLHRNITILYEVYWSETSIALVMELLEGGDLFDTIANNPDGCAAHV
jgi:serine/threonine protein kinase